MPITVVQNNGRGYELAPTLNIRVNTQLPQGSTLQVKRNGVVVGTAVQTGALSYSFTDSANLGQNAYTVDLVLENLTLPSAPYTINTEAVPIPVITSVTDSFLAPVNNNSEVVSQNLIFTITVSPSLLGDAYVDLFKNDVYVGTAVQQPNPEQFVISLEDVGTDTQTYVAKTRVGTFSTVSAPFVLTAPPVPTASIEIYVSEPDAMSIAALCHNQTVPGTNDFIFELAIGANVPTGQFYLGDENGTALDLLHPLATLSPIDHVQGTATYMVYDSASDAFAIGFTGIVGSIITLLDSSDNPVSSTQIPLCGSGLVQIEQPVEV